MGDVSSSCIDQRLSSLELDILLDELRQIVNLAVEADPAVVSGAVLRYFFRSVELSELVRPRQVGCLLDTRQL